MITITNTLSGTLATPIATLVSDGSVTSTNNDLLPFIIVVAMSLVLALSVMFYNWLKDDNDYVLEREIETALMPYLQSLIIAAFEETIENLDDIEDKIEDIDKAAFVEKLYDFLPEKIAGYDIGFVQSILTVERVTDIFMSAYHEAKLQYLAKKGKFSELFEDWKN